MDPSHQALLQKRLSTIALVQTNLVEVGPQVLVDFSMLLRLLVAHHQWCGIIVEQLVSDVLALIVGHLELAKDMRAFRLTCTHWNQSFCDNTQLFTNRFWGLPTTVRSVRPFHPSVWVGLQAFFTSDCLNDCSEITRCYNWLGHYSHFAFLSLRHWQMKDELWMQTRGNKVNKIATRGVTLFDCHLNYRVTPESGNKSFHVGPALEFQSSYQEYSAAHVVELRCFKRERAKGFFPDLRFDDPCQTDLLAVQQRVVEIIEVADSIRWNVREDNLDVRMKKVVSTWRKAIVHRRSSRDCIC